jgi:uncharacterized BrkB/YihY/UPF0761 family membrane protein
MTFALSALMALFPFLIVLASLAGFFGSKELADQAVGLLLQIWPNPQKRPIWRRIGNPRFAETGWWCAQSDTNRSPTVIP